MDWITGIQNAINYIEDNLTQELDYDEIARQSYSSMFHFQRVFSILCGYTLGEYIRNRRLTQAGLELAQKKEKVIDVAAKYGYESPESFAKAFQRFHGISPSQARTGGQMKFFPPLSIKISLEGGSVMNYRIEEKDAFTLVAFKRHFTGDPSDKKKQDHYFACETRLEQAILTGVSREHDRIFNVLTNFDPDGYDFYYGYQFPQWAMEELNDLPEDITRRFEKIRIPAGKYLVCETERTQWPCDLQDELRRQAVSQWLPVSGYELREAPEVMVIHWFWEEGNEKLNSSRYSELWLPIEKK